MYQDKEKWELYKEINIFFGVGTKPKTDKTVIHVSSSKLGLKIYVAHYIFEWVLGVVGYLKKKSKYWWGNVHRKIITFSICFVTFTITLVYSGV